MRTLVKFAILAMTEFLEDVDKAKDIFAEIRWAFTKILKIPGIPDHIDSCVYALLIFTWTSKKNPQSLETTVYHSNVCLDAQASQTPGNILYCKHNGFATQLELQTRETKKSSGYFNRMRTI